MNNNMIIKNLHGFSYIKNDSILVNIMNYK